MIGMRAILRTAGLGLVAFGALFLAWPWLGRPYAALFRAQASAVYDVASGAHGIDVVEVREPGRDADTAIRVLTKGAPGYTRVTLRSRFVGYLPTCLFLALFAAAPIRKGRRFGAFLKGMIAVDAAVLARTGLLVLEAWTRHESACPLPHVAGASSAFWGKLLEASLANFVFDPSMYVLIPLVVLLWVVAPVVDPRPARSTAASGGAGRSSRPGGAAPRSARVSGNP